VILGGIVTRPLGRTTGLQHDEPGFGTTPGSVGGGNTRTRPAGRARVSDRLLEVPASGFQRGGARRGGVRFITSLLSLEPGTITFSPLTLRGLPQRRRELLDRVPRFELW
jgi:hypothetical protein